MSDRVSGTLRVEAAEGQVTAGRTMMIDSAVNDPLALNQRETRAVRVYEHSITRRRIHLEELRELRVHDQFAARDVGLTLAVFEARIWGSTVDEVHYRVDGEEVK